jgi:hypothetical protein
MVFSSVAAENDSIATIKEYKSVTEAAEKIAIHAITNLPSLLAVRSGTTATSENPANIPASPASAPASPK